MMYTYLRKRVLYVHWVDVTGGNRNLFWFSLKKCGLHSEKFRDS